FIEGAAFSALGWVSALRGASSGLLLAIGTSSAKVVWIAAAPWMFISVGWFFRSGVADLARALARGIAAACAAFFMFLPAMVLAATSLAGHEPPGVFEDWRLIQVFPGTLW